MSELLQILTFRMNFNLIIISNDDDNKAVYLINY